LVRKLGIYKWGWDDTCTTAYRQEGISPEQMKLLASDDEVDNLRTAFYSELITVMQREPGNIRQGLSLLSVIRNLERIADHSTNIAEDVLFYVKGIDVRHNAEVLAERAAGTGKADPNS